MKTRHSTLSLWLILLPVSWLMGQDTLLLFHPTAYNLEVIQHLMDEANLNLKGYHVLGVYHDQETYDYEKSSAYLELHNPANFSLHEISGSLHPQELFEENSCTGQFQHLFAISRGSLFMGGPDIPPAIYEEPVHLLTEVTDPYRHYCEASYLFHLLGGTQDEQWEPYLEVQPQYLVSGICLGMQTMNVATGGTLVQDIPTEMYQIWYAQDILSHPPEQMHRNYTDKLDTGCDSLTSYHFHPVRLMRKTILTRGIGLNPRKEPLVLSSHHQALEKLGKGWKITATSMDGKIPEAIEHIRYPHVFGVQFHPEKPGLFDPGIIHPQTCSSTISFQEAIKGTDSYAFHLAYWKYLSEILQRSRED